MTGAGGYLKEKTPQVKIVAVEPAASPVLSEEVLVLSAELLSAEDALLEEALSAELLSADDADDVSAVD